MEMQCAIDNFFPFNGGMYHEALKQDGHQELKQDMQAQIAEQNARISKAAAERQRNLIKQEKHREQEAQATMMGMPGINSD